MTPGTVPDLAATVTWVGNPVPILRVSRCWPSIVRSCAQASAGTFGDRLPGASWLVYFPTAAAVEAAMFPTLPQVEAQFAVAGLRPVALDVVRVQAVESAAEYVERLRMRAISTFEHLPEDEIERGFARMDADVASGTPAFRLAEDGDQLVLELAAD